MKKSTLIYIQFLLSASVGATIACSPTKFAVAPSNLCTSSNETCLVSNSFTDVTQSFKVGSGKVDILFVDDNSASMFPIQTRLAARFGGFVEALDQREIDYHIAVTTTDKNFFTSTGLVTFGNGQKILKNSDTSRVSLFNGAIVRAETSDCENFIKSQYYTYGPSFNQRAEYAQQYAIKCASGDERGINAAYEVISKNTASIIRPDANLNIILLSNEDVRSSIYGKNPAYALEHNDKATSLINMINTTYAGKFWEFNSIITKDANCVNQQRQSFLNANGQPFQDEYGNYVFDSNIGLEYAAVSASASQDIDGMAAPRGRILDICSSDYATHFSDIAAKIADSARLLTLKCKPQEAPVVTNTNGQQMTIPYSWDGDSKITFQRGSEGLAIKVAYRCYTGVR